MAKDCPAHAPSHGGHNEYYCSPKKHFKALQEAYKGTIYLYLAPEYMIDNLSWKRLNNNLHLLLLRVKAATGMVAKMKAMTTSDMKKKLICLFSVSFQN